MKKILLLLVGLSIFGMANAQHFGLFAGPQMTNMSMENATLIVKTNFKPGFFAGFTVDFPLNNNMVINSSISYKTGGTIIDNGSLLDDDTEVLVLRTDNISLDLTYLYLFDLNTIQLYAEGGGYLGYAMGGKYVYKPKDGDKYTEPLKIGSSDTDDLKAFDFGITIGAGVYMNKFKFGLGFQQGLFNLSTSDDSQDVARNQAVFAKVAYFFNRK